MIVQMGRAAQVAQAAQTAQAKALNDVKSIATALTSISESLHTVTKKLERAVEGTYASDLGDPRVQLLAETLHVARAGDLRHREPGAVEHNGPSIHVVVTPADCARCHGRESAEFANSHHAKGGEILGSLDNTLAEVVEGNKAFFGGSALLMTMLSTGVLLNISQQAHV